MLKISTLSSVYYKENPKFFSASLMSVYEQSLQPTEVVIVHDGPLTDELYDVISYWKQKLPIVEVKLSENVGLGKALNIGLSHCSNDIVIRVDTDDVNFPDRFEKQVNLLEAQPELSVIGCQIIEFEREPNDCSRIRMVPDYANLKQFALVRNPLNHMGVAFRKSVIEAVGSYQDHFSMEDYYLWLRVLAAGYKIDNLQEPLVHARVGNGMLERRRGYKYAVSEIKLMLKIYRLGLTKSPKTFFIFLARAFSRLIPVRLLSKIYSSTRS